MKHFGLIFPLAAFLLCSAHPALSRPMTATFSGVVVADDGSGQDIDVADLFGGGDLAGKDVTAIYSFDTSLGTEQTDGQTYDVVSGGPDFGGNPVFSVKYAINGFSYTFAPDQFSSIDTQIAGIGGPAEPGVFSLAANSSQGDQSLSEIYSALAPAQLTQAFSSQADPASVDLFNYFLPGRSNTTQLDALTFNLSQVVSAAPEPSIWGMMLIGVAMAGVALRADRRRSAVL